MYSVSKKLLRICLFALLALILCNCAASPLNTGVSTKNRQSQVKNLILLIGDGMGPQQVGLLMEYAKWSRHSVFRNDVQNTAIAKFSQDGYIGLSTTHPADRLVTDSACSATQLASGVASGNEMLGLDALGNPVPSILELAKAAGKATGLVSDTRITHATPAAFASHQAHRSMENAIAVEMLTGDLVDVMLSGGLQFWLPQSVNSDAAITRQIKAEIDDTAITVKSKRQDELNLLAQAKKQGYALVFNQKQMQNSDANRLIGLFAASGMCDAIAYLQHECGQQPSLAAMTHKALDLLAQNENGFFLMVEGGQIDWAGHNNDAGQLLHEMLRFDQAVEVVYEWVRDRRDTLVVITADHETGGFGFSYSRNDLPKPKRLPGDAFRNILFQPNFNFGTPNTLDKLYRQKKSFANIWQLAKPDKGLPSAAKLVESVNANSEFKINLAQAESILELEKHEYRQPGHRYLAAEHFPKINDFKEFYVIPSRAHLDLIGRALAKQQNVVWSTGTHTDTPVPVITFAPEAMGKDFSKIMHHTELGKKMINVLLGE